MSPCAPQRALGEGNFVVLTLELCKLTAVQFRGAHTAQLDAMAAPPDALDALQSSGAFRKQLPLPQYEGARAQVDNTLYGRELEGTFVPRRGAEGMPPAGKPTQTLNAAFSAYEYKPGRLEHGRSFLMDDYLVDGRRSRPQRENLNLAGDQCFAALQYQRDIPHWQPTQGFSDTKFHNGFYRRQQGSIGQDVERIRNTEQCEVRHDAIRQVRGRRLDDVTSFKYNGYNIITGEDFDPTKDRSRRPEARHVRDHAEARETGLSADTAGGRLRDSTSRFYCTPQQMPHRAPRQQTIENDGLVTTKRTSTVIGIGVNPSQEIKSIGARENFTESVYAIRRRNAVADRAADVAMVASLK